MPSPETSAGHHGLPPDGLNTEVVGRAAAGIYRHWFPDYDVGWNDNGNWGNYTQDLPAGSYNI